METGETSWRQATHTNTMSATYVIADLHLGHHTLAELRGFWSADEHDKAFEAAWFDTVKGCDVVWLLGDIAFNLKALRRLANWPGRKKLVLGNHDKAGLSDEAHTVYKSIRAYAVVDKTVLLAHIPVHPSSLRPRFRGQIHGHTHALGSPEPIGYLSVCPEEIGLAPIRLHEAIATLDAKLGRVAVR